MICINCFNECEVYEIFSKIPCVKYNCEHCRHNYREANGFNVWIDDDNKIVRFHWENHKYLTWIRSYIDEAYIGPSYQYHKYHYHPDPLFAENGGTVYDKSIYYKVFCPPKQLTIPSILDTLERATMMSNFQ